jgi:DNA-binding response OmpR family regulator
MPVTILVVDGEPGWHAALRRALEPEGYQVETAADGDEALAIAWSSPPSLIILDLLLPGMDGVEVCGRLRRHERSQHVPIIVLSERGDTTSKIDALESGADDYVTKPCDFDELRARVRARLRRPAPAHAAPAALALRLDRARREVVLDGHVLPLTRREYDLFELLFGEVGRLVPREAIVREVWGGACSPDANIVDVYVRRLRRKLDAAAYGGRIRTVWGIGYLLELGPAAAGESGG